MDGKEGLLFEQQQALLQRRELHRTAVKLDFALSDDDLRYLRKVYEPHVIRPGLGLATDHPIAAAHQRFGEAHLLRYARKNRPCLHIGPTLPQLANLMKDQPYDHHGCCKLDARDAIRALNGAMDRRVQAMRSSANDREIPESLQHLTMGRSTRLFCANGSENCDFKAPFAVANQSMYDIDPKMWALIFHKHGIHEVRGYLHLVPAAFHVNEFYDQRNRIYHKIDKHGSIDPDKWDIIIGFGDHSWMYRHKWRSYRPYMACSGYHTPFGFNIGIEINKVYGSNAYIRMYRLQGPVTIDHMLPTSLKGYVRLPDVMQMASRGFTPNYIKGWEEGDYPCILANADKCRKIYAFLLARSAPQRNLELAYAYGRSALSSIKLGEYIIEESWDCSIDHFQRVVLALLVCAEYQSAKQHTAYEMAQVEIDKVSRKQTGSLSKLLSKVCPSVVRAVVGIHNRVEAWFKPHRDFLDPNKKLASAITACFVGVYEDELCTTKLKGFRSEIATISWDDIPYGSLESTPAVVVNSGRIEVSAPPMQAQNYEPTDQEQLQSDLDKQMDMAYQICLKQYDHSIAKAQIDGATALATVINGAKSALEARGSSKLVLKDVNGVFGVPGASKSTDLIENIIPTTPGITLVVVPTNNLMRSFMERVPLPHRVMTTHAAMSALHRGSVKPSLIAIDEAFCRPLVELAFFQSYAPLVLLGDPFQIGFIDFDSMWGGIMTMDDVWKSIPHKWLNTTKRCPQDVLTRPLISRCYPGITSTSRVGADNGINRPSIVPKHKNFKSHTAKVITPTQAAKELCTAEGAITVAESQGTTFKEVILHLDGSDAERRLMGTSPKHLVVALTRHTEHLYVREAEPGLLQAYEDACINYMTNPVALDLAMHETKPAMPDFGVATDFGAKVEPQNIPNLPLPPPNPSSWMAADNIVSRTYPAAHDVQEHQVVEHLWLPDHRSRDTATKAVLRLDELIPDHVRDSKAHRARRFPVPQRVKITTSGKTATALHTMVSRYTKATKRLTSAVAKAEGRLLFEVISEYINWDYTDDDVRACYADMLEKFQNKGLGVPDLEEAAFLGDFNSHKVGFMTKQQQKIVSFDPLNRDKAGQGIAAWGKFANFRFGVWMRLLEKIIHRSKIPFLFASGRTDEQILRIIEAAASSTHMQYFSGDFSEFDSTQGQAEREYATLYLKRIGMPEDLIVQFNAMCRKRQVDHRVASVVVEHKKDSGRVDTLVGNTMYCAAVILSLISNRQEIALAAFKGDDSLVVAPRLVIDFRRLNELNSKQGLILKYDMGLSAEFIGHVINANGASVDLIRIAAKVLSRVYKSQQDYAEYQTAVRDLIKPVSGSVIHESSRVLGAHYRLGEGEFDNVWSFLHNFAHGHIPYSQLVVFEEMTLTNGADVVRVCEDQAPPTAQEVVAQSKPKKRQAPKPPQFQHNNVETKPSGRRKVTLPKELLDFLDPSGSDADAESESSGFQSLPSSDDELTHVEGDNDAPEEAFNRNDPLRKPLRHQERRVQSPPTVSASTQLEPKLEPSLGELPTTADVTQAPQNNFGSPAVATMEPVEGDQSLRDFHATFAWVPWEPMSRHILRGKPWYLDIPGKEEDEEAILQMRSDRVLHVNTTPLVNPDSNVGEARAHPTAAHQNPKGHRSLAVPLRWHRVLRVHPCRLKMAGKPLKCSECGSCVVNYCSSMFKHVVYCYRCLSTSVQHATPEKPSSDKYQRATGAGTVIKAKYGRGFLEAAGLFICPTKSRPTIVIPGSASHKNCATCPMAAAFRDCEVIGFDPRAIASKHQNITIYRMDADQYAESVGYNGVSLVFSDIWDHTRPNNAIDQIASSCKPGTAILFKVTWSTTDLKHLCATIGRYPCQVYRSFAHGASSELYIAFTVGGTAGTDYPCVCQVVAGAMAYIPTIPALHTPWEPTMPNSPIKPPIPAVDLDPNAPIGLWVDQL
nr:putative replicase [Helianthus astrovirus A]QVG60632.1 putative replicase [Helianthus astrovirus A]